MRIVITGASGNVGTSLTTLLQNDNRVDEIVGIARRKPSWTLPKVRFVQREIGTDDLGPDLAGADALIHLAWIIQPARDLAAMHQVNVVGSRRLWDAAAKAGVPTIIHASSVGAYSPRRGTDPVSEDYPTDGIVTSAYSRQKAYVERQLDAFELAHPDTRVVRLRPGLIFKGGAATEIHDYFLGPLVPRALLRRDWLPALPDDGRIRFQAVHSDDIARAYQAVLHSDIRGAVNVADEAVIDMPRLAELLETRTVRIPSAAIRAAAATTFAARLQPTPAGWVDLAQQAPAMDISRAHDRLDWRPQRSGADALLELLEGLSEGWAGRTPPLKHGAPE
ncbi:NAD-dependent epimerase/dehydratase family protein [soil metagenome]